MGGHGESTGAGSAGSGSPDSQAVDTEDHGRDRRESGTTHEGYVKPDASWQSLVKWIEANFDCWDGHYGSHADGPNLDPDKSTIDEAAADAKRREAYRYVTLAYMTGVTRSRNPEIQKISDGNALTVCRAALFADFVTLRSQFPKWPKPILYWRYHESQRMDEEIDAGVKRRAKIWTRVAIPGADFEKIPSVKPEGEPARIL